MRAQISESVEGGEPHALWNTVWVRGRRRV